MKKKTKTVQVTDKLKDSLYQIKDILADTKDDMQGRASELVDEVLDNIKSQSQERAEDLENYVQEQPLKSLALVALAGFVIGKFIL